MSCTSKPLTPQYEVKYEEFINQQKEVMIYYSLAYRDLISEFTGASSNYWIAVDSQDQIVGAMPLMFKNGKYGKVYNSLPFYGSNGGPLTDSKEAEECLLRKYAEIVQSEEVASSTLIENPFKVLSQNLGVETNQEDYRIGQITPLPSEGDVAELLMSSFHTKTRNMVRKPMKDGVEWQIDNSAFDFLYEIHVQNMEAIEGAAKPKRFFDILQRHLNPGTGYDIYVATIDGERAAAMLVLYYGKCVEYFTPVIVSEYRSSQALSLLIYQAMIEGAKKGYEWWNWGGTWESQEGVYRFKSRLGARDLKYKYNIQVRNSAILEATKEELLLEYAYFYVLPFSSLIG